MERFRGCSGGAFVWDGALAASLREQQRIVGAMAGCSLRAAEGEGGRGLPLALSAEEAALAEENQGLAQPLLTHSARTPANADSETPPMDESRIRLDFHPSTLNSGTFAEGSQAGQGEGRIQDLDHEQRECSPARGVGPTAPSFKERVFRELHAQGYTMTSAAKFGAQFLAYQEDPSHVHSALVVRSLESQRPVALPDSAGIRHDEAVGCTADSDQRKAEGAEKGRRALDLHVQEPDRGSAKAPAVCPGDGDTPLPLRTSMQGEGPPAPSTSDYVNARSGLQGSGKHQEEGLEHGREPGGVPGRGLSASAQVPGSSGMGTCTVRGTESEAGIPIGELLTLARVSLAARKRLLLAFEDPKGSGDVAEAKAEVTGAADMGRQGDVGTGCQGPYFVTVAVELDLIPHQLRTQAHLKALPAVGR